MTIWDFMDKHMGWCVVFGIIASALCYSVVMRLENYMIQRLRAKVAIAAKQPLKNESTT